MEQKPVAVVVEVKVFSCFSLFRHFSQRVSSSYCDLFWCVPDGSCVSAVFEFCSPFSLNSVQFAMRQSEKERSAFHARSKTVG
jgi:hypothetical protein